MDIEHLFFELLQVAIGTRKSLSAMPTSEEWALLFEMAKKQALVAIAFAGVTKLNTASDYGASLGIPEMVYLKWLGLVAKTQQRNLELNGSCASLCKDLAHEGLYACILKGQSNLANYPEELRDCRTPGDIDVWCAPMDPCGMDIAVADADGRGAHYEKYQGYRGVIEWVLADWRLKSDYQTEVQYHHIDWKYEGIECEVHFRPSWMNNPIYNARLQQWCKDNEQWLNCDYDGFNIPSAEFNAVYQIVHIYRHLFNEGIGLRQLLDYYFVLQVLHIGRFQSNNASMGMWDEGLGMGAKSKTEIMQTLSTLGIKPFTSAVMYVLQKVFNMPSEYCLCEPDEKRGEFLLNEIMLAGNFGKYDSRNVIGQNESYLNRFVRRQKRFLRFLTQYPSEVFWGPYFTVKQRAWRMIHGWR